MHVCMPHVYVRPYMVPLVPVPAEGYLFVDEALRIIRVYSQVHRVTAVLHMDRLWQHYRDCSVLHKDGLLIHVQDAIHCLSDCF